MLHWFCGIGMSDLHDNNLVQGWEKNWKLNLVWYKKRKAHRFLLIQTFWFCHLMAPVPLYLWNEKKQKKLNCQKFGFSEKQIKICLYLLVCPTQTSPTKYYIVGMILVVPFLILNTVATLCRPEEVERLPQAPLGFDRNKSVACSFNHWHLFSIISKFINIQWERRKFKKS